LGWRLDVLSADVLDLVHDHPDDAWEATIANLFLHHFTEAQLTILFQALAKRTHAVVAVEPRRSAFAFAASRMVWTIGCNRVTQHDAPVSVRAGFRGRELSGLWPASEHWSMEECRAGLFSHLFVAQRRERL
jgi:hypothetical protein